MGVVTGTWGKEGIKTRKEGSCSSLGPVIEVRDEKSADLSPWLLM